MLNLCFYEAPYTDTFNYVIFLYICSLLIKHMHAKIDGST